MQADSQRPTSQPSSDDDPTLPAPIDLDKLTVSEAFSSLWRALHYPPALPERLRNVRAYASEIFRESANWIVPAAFRNSRSYSIFVRQMMDYIIRDASAEGNLSVAGQETSGAMLAPHSLYCEDQVFVARKTVGSLLDMAALATFHVSPLAVLAIFSEVAYQSKTHIRLLGTRLTEQRILAPNLVIDDSSQLIAALEKALGSTAGMFDQPLVSTQGLRKTVQETQTVVAQTEPSKLLPLYEMDQLLRQMELAARLEKASIWDVSATISVVALNHIQSGCPNGLVSLEIAGNLFQHHVIDHYWEGLRSIERHGLLPTLSHASQPFLETFWNNYSIDQKTWKEQLLSGELLKWGWSQLTWPKLTGR